MRAPWLRPWFHGSWHTASATPTKRSTRRKPGVKPELLVLEDRITPSAADPTPPWDPHQILVQFRQGVQVADNLHLLAGTHVGIAPAPLLLPNVYVIHLDDGVTVESALAAYTSRTDLVEFADPDWYRSLQAVPNDPNFGQMYGLNNTGQTIQGQKGVVDADLDAPEAWDITTGSGNFIVADVDTGFDYTHPDLKANLWTNPGEIAGDKIDNDKNGWVDDVYGIDVAAGDGDPMDTDGHGTHTAGTIGAVGDNGVGVTGINQHVKIMSIRIFGPGYAGDSKVIQGLNYAITMGAKVANHSWGGGGFSNTLSTGFKNSAKFQFINVCAAGNAGTNNDVQPFYPANINSANIVSVGASDNQDNMAGFSCFGATTVDLFAPGVDVLSTLPGNNYGFASGTSMAAPHVTGAIALLWDNAPTMTYQQVIARLLATVDTKPAFNGKCVTGGRLNLNKLLNHAPTLAAISDKTVDELSLLSFTANGSDFDTTDKLTYSITGGPAGTAINANTGLFTWTPTEAQGPGTYNVTIRVTDNGVPQQFAERTFKVDVIEVNDAPVFNPAIGNKIVDEGSLLSFTVTASDTEGDPFQFKLMSGPAGASIDAKTGLFTFTPTEAQGPGDLFATIRVFQNTPLPMFTDETIKITVNEVNVAPVINPIADQFGSEFNKLTFQATASDADLPGNGLSFSLIGAPAAASIDAKTGVITWTPGEDDGGQKFNFTVRVTDDGTPNLFAETTVNVNIGEVNSAPDILPIGDFELLRGSGPLTFQAKAVDADTPANTLNFFLEPGTPFGAAVDKLTGNFTWTPLPNQQLGTYEFTITVRDDGVPSMSDSETFQVTLTNEPIIITGANNLQVPMVHVFDVKSGQEKFSLLAFRSGFRGGVHVGAGDINGDGKQDVIAAMGNGGLSRIRVFNGIDGTPITSFGTNGEIVAYAKGFHGGSWVASTYWDGDNKADVVVGPGNGTGSGGVVKIFSGANGQLLTSFKPYGNGFQGGVRVSTGDVDGDGTIDIVTSPAAGLNTFVRVFSGANLAQIDEFRAGFPNPNNPYGGYFTAVGDLNQDGKAEIIVTPGAGQVPMVRIFDRTNAFIGGVTEFLAEDPSYRYAVRVAVSDLDRDGRADIIVGTRDLSARLTATDGQSLSSLDAFFQGYQTGLKGNLFVAGTL